MNAQNQWPASGVRARGIVKRLGGEIALSPTDFDAAAGTVTLLVGPNGAGKTTMLRVLGTLLRPDGGAARVNGRDPVTDGRAVREMLGIALVNERAIYWRLSVLENLELFARIRGVARRDRRAHCLALIDELGLGAVALRRASTLSAGQRQRAILGRALAGSPSVLLIDEPARGLDAEAETLVVDALRKRADQGATVVVATPSAAEYEAFGAGATQHVGALQ